MKKVLITVFLLGIITNSYSQDIFILEPEFKVVVKQNPRIINGIIPQKYPWKLSITSTVFWIGEQAAKNNPVPNDKSSWDSNWQSNYGGVDHPQIRRVGFTPQFTPKQNPFYVALPYNDIDRGTNGIQTKKEAPLVIPWFENTFQKSGTSVCKGRWVAIRAGDKTCYAQWEDCGPFRTDHWQYVFGDERPKPNINKGAGIDISPAVKDYLGVEGIDKVDWRFVEIYEIPGGPWKEYGNNNIFVADKAGTEKMYREWNSIK